MSHIGPVGQESSFLNALWPTLSDLDIALKTDESCHTFGTAGFEGVVSPSFASPTPLAFAGAAVISTPLADADFGPSDFGHIDFGKKKKLTDFGQP